MRKCRGCCHVTCNSLLVSPLLLLLTTTPNSEVFSASVSKLCNEDSEIKSPRKRDKACKRIGATRMYQPSMQQLLKWLLQLGKKKIFPSLLLKVLDQPRSHQLKEVLQTMEMPSCRLSLLMKLFLSVRYCISIKRKKTFTVVYPVPPKEQICLHLCEMDWRGNWPRRQHAGMKRKFCNSHQLTLLVFLQGETLPKL